MRKSRDDLVKSDRQHSVLATATKLERQLSRAAQPIHGEKYRRPPGSSKADDQLIEPHPTAFPQGLEDLLIHGPPGTTRSGPTESSKTNASEASGRFLLESARSSRYDLDAIDNFVGRLTKREGCG